VICPWASLRRPGHRGGVGLGFSEEMLALDGLVVSSDVPAVTVKHSSVVDPSEAER